MKGRLKLPDFITYQWLMILQLCNEYLCNKPLKRESLYYNQYAGALQYM